MDEDCEDLACQFLVASSSSERDRLWTGLAPWIERWAKKISINCIPKIRDEFVHDSPAKIWEKICLYNPQSGSFRAWAWQVLRNNLKDRAKSYRREQDGLRRYGESLRLEEGTGDFGSWRVDWDCGSDNPTCEDLERIRSWRPRERIHLCLLVGNLWLCLPVAERNGWMEREGLPSGFPPESFFQIDTLSGRNAELAALFGASRDSLNQRFRRSRHLLNELHYWRDRF
jgi:hypothetical protein